MRIVLLHGALMPAARNLLHACPILTLTDFRALKDLHGGQE